jgi:UDP-N-acetylglucosamine 2-epimerase (hydrolysing)
LNELRNQISGLVDYALRSNRNFVAIFPNNDEGTHIIQQEYERFKGNEKIRLIPSMRFEYFLTVLRESDFIIGNSSSGVRESSVFGVAAVNLGSRQENRAVAENVVHCGFDPVEIETAVIRALKVQRQPEKLFGDGRSGQRFVEILLADKIWQIKVQKNFVDRIIEKEY